MANPEHLAVLKEGVLTWNRWRTVNPGIEADLSRANLIEVDLSRANLSGADLSDADLRGANLSGADLSGALIVASTNLDLSQVTPAENTNTEVIIAPGQSHDHSP